MTDNINESEVKKLNDTIKELKAQLKGMEVENKLEKQISRERSQWVEREKELNEKLKQTN